MITFGVHVVCVRRAGWLFYNPPVTISINCDYVVLSGWRRRTKTLGRQRRRLRRAALVAVASLVKQRTTCLQPVVVILAAVQSHTESVDDFSCMAAAVTAICRRTTRTSRLERRTSSDLNLAACVARS